MGVPLLDVSHLRKAFGGVVAVADLDMAVFGGEILGLIGPNGAGKTTILNLITGFVAPDSGKVTFAGRDVTGWTTDKLVHEGLARTFQSAAVYGNLSVRENIWSALQAGSRTGIYGRILQGIRPRLAGSLGSEIGRILELTGLAGIANETAAALPYGKQRMVGLAMTLSLSPRLLLLDEPAAGMNGTERDGLLSLMKELRGQGIAIVLVEHDVPLVAAACDRVVVVDYGVKISQGTAKEVQEDPAVVEAYLGRAEE